MARIKGGLNVKLETGKNIKILKYSGEMEIKYMKEGANKPWFLLQL